MIPAEKLHEIIAAAEEATPGDWAFGTPDADCHETRAEWCGSALKAPDEPAADTLWVAWVPDDEEVVGTRIVAITGDGPHGMADARLIATADPTTVSDMARELLGLRAQRDKVLAQAGVYEAALGDVDASARTVLRHVVKHTRRALGAAEEGDR